MLALGTPLCKVVTLCHAIVPPCRKSGFLAGIRLDSSQENFEIGPPAGRRPAGGPLLGLSRFESGRNPAWKPDRVGPAERLVNQLFVLFGLPPPRVETGEKLGGP